MNLQDPDELLKMVDGSGVTVPKTKRGEATFNRLLQAAEEVFGEKNYYEASIVDITNRAGVGQGTFYLYFKSKKDIFVELIKHLHHEIRSFIQQTIASIPNRIDAEKAGVAAYYQFSLKHRNLNKLVRDCECVEPALWQWYYNSFAMAHARHLKAAMDRGEIARANPEALAYCLLGIGLFTAMRWPVWEGQLPPEEIMESVFCFIAGGLTPKDSLAGD